MYKKVINYTILGNTSALHKQTSPVFFNMIGIDNIRIHITTTTIIIITVSDYSSSVNIVIQ